MPTVSISQKEYKVKKIKVLHSSALQLCQFSLTLKIETFQIYPLFQCETYTKLFILYVSCDKCSKQARWQPFRSEILFVGTYQSQELAWKEKHSLTTLNRSRHFSHLRETHLHYRFYDNFRNSRMLIG